MKIAITGSFGSGKSLFCKYISQGNIPIIYADKIGKELLSNHKQEIFDFLNIELRDNYIEVLKKTIINNRDIFERYNRWMYKYLPLKIIEECKKYDNVICDAALIYEWNIAYFFDYIILIRGGSFQQRFNRIKGRNPNKKLYTLLNEYQISDIEKQRYADIIINNNGSKEVLRQYAYKIKHYFFNN